MRDTIASQIRLRAKPVKNMSVTTTEISGVYPPSGGYAHCIVVEDPVRWLFSSGTMGLNESWVAPQTIEDQLSLLWKNIEVILKENDFTLDDIVHLTCMLSDPAYSKLNANAIETALCGRAVPRTVFCPALLESCWLIEIQFIAVKPSPPKNTNA